MGHPGAARLTRPQCLKLFMVVGRIVVCGVLLEIEEDLMKRVLIATFFVFKERVVTPLRVLARGAEAA